MLADRPDKATATARITCGTISLMRARVGSSVTP
jgi:hypothetical protein